MKKLLRKHKKTDSPTNPTNNLVRTRGDRRSEIEEIRLKNEIFSLSDTYNDQEIMDILGMPRASYYRYKSNLLQEQREVWQQTYKEGVEIRVMHLVNAIHLAIRTNKEIINDKTQSARDRMEACNELIEVERGFFDLICDMDKSDTAATPVTAGPYIQPISDPGPKPEWYHENGENKLWDAMIRPEKQSILERHVAESAAGPKPTHPAVLDSRGNWQADPDWIESNRRKLRAESNYEPQA